MAFAAGAGGCWCYSKDEVAGAATAQGNGYTVINTFSGATSISNYVCVVAGFQAYHFLGEDFAFADD